MENIAPNVYRFENQFFYGEQVGTYLIELSNRVILFDLPTFEETLLRRIEKFKKPCSAILSHGSCGIEDGKMWQKKMDLTVYLHKNDEYHPWLRIIPNKLYEQLPEISPFLEIIHTPGHSPGSVCMYDSKNKIMFTGDTLGGSSSNRVKDFYDEPHDDNKKQRIESCRKLLPYKFSIIAPFHYKMVIKNAHKALLGLLNTYE